MRTSRAYGAGSPATLPVVDVARAGAACLSDYITDTGTYNGSWFEIHAVATAVVSVITDTIKTVNGAPPTTVAVTALVVGQTYEIVTVGNTDWTVAGAPANFGVGTVFQAKAVGTGSGTAKQSTQVIQSIPLVAGDSIYGSFQQITAASGKLIAYRDGSGK